MTIECYYRMCPRHSCHTEGDEGPFCSLDRCEATDAERSLYATARKLLKLGYDLEELELDNPYRSES